MAVEGQFGSIYFSVRPGLQKPESVVVNDRSTGTDENGFVNQSTRKLLMFFKGDDLVHFDLDVHTNKRFISKPVSTTVA